MERRFKRAPRAPRWLRILAIVPLVTSCAGSAYVSGHLVPRGAAASGLDQAVVYVQPADPGARPVSDWTDRLSITFEHGALQPVVSAAMAGSWLEIWNADSVYHQPFSRSPAAPFEARTIRPGTGTAIRLPAKGMIQIFCQLHEGEAAELLVLDKGAWTRPDTAGAFHLPPLPKGRYVIHAWHPRLGEKTVPLDVERPGPVSVDVPY
jgi:hypothetical protein